EEGGDNAAAAATLSPEDSYSPNKSVRVAELDLALDLSIGRNHSKVRSFFSSLASSSSSLTRTLYSSSCGLEPGNPLSVRNGFTIIKASLFHFIWEEVSISEVIAISLSCGEVIAISLYRV
ncbi:hypothetical protein HID58_053673, partial [Brassica napus]